MTINIVLLVPTTVTGSLPAELGRLNLTALLVDDNLITVRTLLGFVLLVSVYVLTLDALLSFSIQGPIPSEFGDMPLETLSVPRNRISGVIPTELGLLSSSLGKISLPVILHFCDYLTFRSVIADHTEKLDLSNNSLQGELPSQLLGLRALAVCKLGES